MKLIELSYTDTNWELRNLCLGDVNLLVGQNATGKSRTLSTIDLLYKMITQKRDLNWGSKWELKFINHKKQSIVYQFATSQRKEGVTFEKITVDGRQVLYRGETSKRNMPITTLYSSLSKKTEEIFPPKDKLVLHVRRDVKNYPFLEDLVEWAEQSYGFKFGNISPYSGFNQQEYDLLTSIEDIPALYSSLQKENKLKIIAEFNEIGYAITDISIQQKGDLVVINVQEEGLTKKHPHYNLSQGMFRTLSVIIYLEYLISRKRPATVIIDDLCEGLDYARASKLSEIVFAKCKKHNIQLIATSNDSFLMDKIDIEYWNVLVRKGKIVEVINYQSHPELFEQFRFTGLSNFDFFASDYLSKTEIS
ncbi:ATP-binding protein [Roseivirga thermotolerans]|uniref:ATPase AAA-type core domain-containing protein n=1 Tax=Roseivirga thermotolerans TaxID=1758176 RepID=A0ABQ3IBE4_9BACT|nr:ATP-binding protein [Roseivirga thermotolerans]GHE73129.1 hypothetical protein GCM10011340_32070 [Roseivirga thermotolerans]